MLRLDNGDIEKGKKIIKSWDKNGTLPDGWKADSERIIQAWQEFTEKEALADKTTLIVTSNGIMRFAPEGLCIFEKNDKEQYWSCSAWNIKPYELYEI